MVVLRLKWKKRKKKRRYCDMLSLFENDGSNIRIRILCIIFCIPLYVLPICCYVFFFFFILNFCYFIKQVKQIYVKLWLVKYKVEYKKMIEMICIPNIHPSKWILDAFIVATQQRTWDLKGHFKLIQVFVRPIN